MLFYLSFDSIPEKRCDENKERKKNRYILKAECVGEACSIVGENVSYKYSPGGRRLCPKSETKAGTNVEGASIEKVKK